MKVTGFSFIKNAVKYEYPIVEALNSILPLCDDIVVAVGNSDDNTRDLVASIAPGKITVIDTVWDEAIKQGGRVLAVETNKALQAINAEADWLVYIQGDEVMHDAGHEEVFDAMQRWKDAKEVDGLLFKYRHFYGSFDYVGMASNWYRKEIRVIKNDKSIYSYRDAQGFRKGDNQKLNVKPLNAYIHHYGWVREPEAMRRKYNDFGKFWNGDEWLEAFNKKYTGPFDYSGINYLAKYAGTHPKVMQERVARMNWQFDYDLSFNKVSLKDRFRNVMERLTGKRPFEYQNYRIV